MAKTPATWQNHPLVHPHHESQLDKRAALLEFHHGLPRHQAEAQALEEYRKEQSSHAARHHATGMKLALAAGHHDAASQHHEAYQRHMKALGLDPSGPPPDTGKVDVGSNPMYQYTPHGADQYIVEDEKSEEKEPVQKSETFISAAKGILALAWLKAFGK